MIPTEKTSREIISTESIPEPRPPLGGFDHSGDGLSPSNHLYNFSGFASEDSVSRFWIKPLNGFIEREVLFSMEGNHLINGVIWGYLAGNFSLSVV